MADSVSTATLPHVYRMSPVRRMIIDAIALAMVSVPVAIGLADPPNRGAAIVIFLVISPTLLFLMFTSWYPRLTLTDKGLRGRGLIGYSTQTIPWSNIESIWLHPGKEGLILREPLQSRSARQWKNWSGMSFAGARIFDDDQRRFIEQQRYMPMQMFAYWLRHADMANELAARIPSLANDLQSQMAAYRKEQSAENRKLLIVFLVSFLIIAATGAYAVWSRSQPAARRAALKTGEDALGVFAGRAFAFALGVYAMANLRSAYGFWRRKHPGYAVFWFLFAVMQILIVVSIFAG